MTFKRWMAVSTLVSLGFLSMGAERAGCDGSDQKPDRKVDLVCVDTKTGKKDDCRPD